MLASLIGTCAAVLATASFIPQVWKVFRTRRTRDISLGMYVMFCAGVFLWMIYGVLIAAAPLILANLATLLMALAVLVMKLKYK